MTVLPNLEQQLLLLQAENAKLRAAVVGKSMKVSEKGALSVYGLGRFPVTLYQSQWDKLISMIPAIEQFMVDHADELATKED